jgi:hypothetical protein
MMTDSKMEQSSAGLIGLKYSPHEIGDKTREIYHEILASSKNINQGNFTRIGSNDLRTIFELYDRSFFDNYFTTNYDKKISFQLSKRMTSAGGKTIYRKGTKTFEIGLSTTLIFQSFHDIDREVKVNGIVCHDRVEAVMRIFEHEIIHLLEFALFEKSSCSQPQFKMLSRNIFNHSDVTHQLITPGERAHKKYNLRVGDRVAFRLNGQTYNGVLARITKSATVMVNNPGGHIMDFEGNRYVKWYVPVHFLKPLNEVHE